MKKTYLVICMFSAVVLAGCSLKVQKTVDTPMEKEEEKVTTIEEKVNGEETENVVNTGNVVDIKELTGTGDSGEVSSIEGSEYVNVNEGLSAEVDKIIEERNTQPKDESKLTEEDIDLIQQIIDKIESMKK